MNRNINGINPHRLMLVFMSLMLFCLFSYRNSLVVYAAELPEPPVSSMEEVLSGEERQEIYSVSEDVHAVRVMMETTYNCWMPLALVVFLVFVTGKWIYRTFISPFVD